MLRIQLWSHANDHAGVCHIEVPDILPLHWFPINEEPMFFQIISNIFDQVGWVVENKYLGV